MFAPLRVNAPVCSVPTEADVPVAPLGPALRIAPGVVFPRVTVPLIVPVPPNVVPLPFTVTLPVPVPEPEALLTSRVPLLTVVVPPYVLFPVSRSVPLPL